MFWVTLNIIKTILRYVDIFFPYINFYYLESGNLCGDRGKGYAVPIYHLTAIHYIICGFKVAIWWVLSPKGTLYPPTWWNPDWWLEHILLFSLIESAYTAYTSNHWFAALLQDFISALYERFLFFCFYIWTILFKQLLLLFIWCFIWTDFISWTFSSILSAGQYLNRGASD